METESKHPFDEFDAKPIDREVLIAQLKDVTAHRDILEARVEVLNAENRALQGQASSLSKKVRELQKLRTDIDSLAATWSQSTAVGAVEVRAVLRSLQVTP